MTKEIADFSWYQTIEFEPGVVSHGCPWCGDPAWENIKRFLPDSLDGKSVLDLGCNAGIFCVRSALMGAEYCLGIESNTWKADADYIEQAVFVRDYFEKKHDRYFQIMFMQGDMEDVLKGEIGKFDYCLAIACLYYVNDQDFVIRRLSEICQNVIARIRDEDRITKLTGLFEKHGFKLKDKYREEWDKRLGIPADDFYLFHYAR